MAGDGLASLNAILGSTGGPLTQGGQRTFKNGELGFYALLALPNCVSAVWLVHDHGTELGISGIRQITVTSAKSIIIDFTVAAS